MSIFKKLRSWYYELWDYIDESEYVLINKKGKVVAIIDRLNPITYTILSHIFTESHDIYATKEEYLGIHFLLKPINGPWLTEGDIESINKSLKEFYLTYQNIDKLLQSPRDFPKNEILSNEYIVKNLKRKSDCIFFEYEDFAEKTASNEYAQKVYEAYLKFESICKKMGLIQSQY